MPSDIQKDEFSGLLAANRAQLYGYILALVMRNADADDVFQQAAVVMWQKFDDFDPSTNFLSWACRIAYFEAKNFARQSKAATTEQFSELLDALAEDDYVGQHQAPRHDALRECLSKLKTEDRSLLDAVYRDDQSVTRLAQSLGRTRRGVSNSLSRIRRALLACIQRVLAAGPNAEENG